MECEAEEERRSLSRVSKVCKVIGIVLKVLFVVICIYWAFAAGLMLLSLINPQSFNIADEASIPRFILYLFYIGIIVAMFIPFIAIFSDTAKGYSPFTLLQVRRLRFISLMLLLYSILDYAIAYNSALLQLGNMNIGYVSTYGSGIATLNFGPLIAAAVVYAFSFVFKYGVLLQKFSDDTV